MEYDKSKYRIKENSNGFMIQVYSFEYSGILCWRKKIWNWYPCAYNLWPCTHYTLKSHSPFHTLEDAKEWIIKIHEEPKFHYLTEI